MSIALVYQDCPLCGAKKDWGEKQIAKANAAGIEVRQVSFASPEGQHLCKEAVLAGVEKLPFFTNGLVFRATIDDFIEAPKPKATKKRYTRKKKTEADNGAD